MGASSPPTGSGKRASAASAAVTDNYKYVLAFRQRKREQLAELLLAVEARQGEVLTLQQENQVLRVRAGPARMGAWGVVLSIVKPQATTALPRQRSHPAAPPPSTGARKAAFAHPGRARRSRAREPA